MDLIAGRLPAELWQRWLAAQDAGRALGGLAWGIRQLAHPAAVEIVKPHNPALAAAKSMLMLCRSRRLPISVRWSIWHLV